MNKISEKNEKDLIKTPEAHLSMDNNIDSALTKASEIYSNNTELRVLIAAIPHVGGSIDILLSNKAQIVFQKRVKLFIGYLCSELQELKKESVNKDYFESEEGFDLLLKAFEMATKTRSDEKILLYSKILRGAAEIRHVGVTIGESFLSVIAELSVEELELAKIIYDMHQSLSSMAAKEMRQVPVQGWKELLLTKCPKHIADNLTFYLKRLESTGLISEITGTFTDYIGGDYRITDTFKTLMDFIGGSDASTNS